LTLPTEAFAQNCDAILSEKLLSSSTSQTSRNISDARAHWACYSSASDVMRYLEQSDSEGGGGEIGFSFGPLKLSGAGRGTDAESVTSQDIEKWKTKNCRSNDDKYHRSAFQYLSQKSLHPDAIAAWRDCVTKQEGLSCYVRPYTNGFVLVYNWNSKDAELPIINRLDVSPPSLNVSADKTVYLGENSLFVPDIGADGTLTMSIIHRNRYAFQCSASVVSAKLQSLKENYGGAWASVCNDNMCGDPNYGGDVISIVDSETLQITPYGRQASLAGERMRYVEVQPNTIVYWSESAKVDTNCKVVEPPSLSVRRLITSENLKQTEPK
jgi:hypothetical protein